MALDESLTMVSSSILDDDIEDTDDGFHQTRHSSLSRLSICTSSLYDEDEDDDDAAAAANNPSDLGIFMSGLSLESFDGADADGEVSDVDKGGGKEQGGSDSDKEPGFYSLPETPSRRRRKVTVGGGSVGSEKERKKDGSKCNIRRERRGTKEKKPSWIVNEGVKEYSKSVEGESDGGGGAGLTVITRPKGGNRSLRMDLGEVRACRDLGFELEHEWMIPGRVSVSAGSTLETQTSSGGNSPIANWRISSPGDDPREVKARLKVWAQAVALASASRHAS